MKPPLTLAAFAALATIVASAMPGAAQSPGHFGTSWSQRMARADGSNVIAGGEFASFYMVTKTVKITTPDGKEMQRQVAECVCEPRSAFITGPASGFNAHTADRQPIPEDELLKRLEKETVVFVCDPYTKADPAYVSLLRPETICLFLPVQQYAGPPPEPGQATAVPKFEKNLPARIQPAAALARLEGDKCVVRHRNVTYHEQTAFRTLDGADGRRLVPYSIRTTTTSENAVQVPTSEVRGYDMAGQPLAAEALADALKQETAVLVSGDGQPVDPAFLEIVKPGTLILALPVAGSRPPMGAPLAAPPAAGGAPLPAPAPAAPGSPMPPPPPLPSQPLQP